jgi:hypothetical protein
MDTPKIEYMGMCWMNVERPCYDECVAFNDSAEEDDPRWKHCLVLKLGLRASEALVAMSHKPIDVPHVDPYGV